MFNLLFPTCFSASKHGKIYFPGFVGQLAIDIDCFSAWIHLAYISPRFLRVTFPGNKEGSSKNERHFLARRGCREKPCCLFVGCQFGRPYPLNLQGVDIHNG